MYNNEKKIKSLYEHTNILSYLYLYIFFSLNEFKRHIYIREVDACLVIQVADGFLYILYTLSEWKRDKSPNI